MHGQKGIRWVTKLPYILILMPDKLYEAFVNVHMDDFVNGKHICEYPDDVAGRFFFNYIAP